MNSDIVLQDVILDFKDTRALDGISCTMHPGKIYGLIGRNGAGKTSMLSLIASFRQPSSGSVLVGGEEPFEHARRMEDVHFVYSWDMSEEDDTITDALNHYARYRPQFDMDFARELLAKFKLDGKKVMNKLSVGMQAAVNVIEGLASGAPVTIFDEVHHGMDAPSRNIFYESLLDCRETQDRLFILSTHLVSEMAYLFDHVLILDHGKLIIDEPYDTLLERGVTVTGEQERVETFLRGRSVIDRKQLGGTLAAMLFGSLTAEESQRAVREGLDISPVSLQELFIHLTKEAEANEINQQ